MLSTNENSFAASHSANVSEALTTNVKKFAPSPPFPSCQV